MCTTIDENMGDLLARSLAADSLHQDFPVRVSTHEEYVRTNADSALEYEDRLKLALRLAHPKARLALANGRAGHIDTRLVGAASNAAADVRDNV